MSGASAPHSQAGRSPGTTGGVFVLRIEDTDQSRVPAVHRSRALEHTLRWLGLDWDEGPETRQGHASPYLQSEQLGPFATTGS